MKFIPELHSVFIWAACGDQAFVSNIKEMNIIAADWFGIFKNVVNSRSPIRKENRIIELNLVFVWNFMYPYFAKLLHNCVMRSTVW